MRQHADFDEDGKVIPDPEDFAAVAGTPDDPSKTRDQNDAHKYRLACARKLIRLAGFNWQCEQQKPPQAA